MRSTQIVDEHMARIPKEHFGSALPLVFDVFLRLGTGNFVQLAKSGSISKLHEMKVFETPGLSHLYIHRGEYGKYVEQTVNQATVLSMVEGGWQARAQALGKAVAAISEWMRVSEFTPAAWAQSQKAAQMIQELVPLVPALPSLLIQVERMGEAAVRHSIMTVILSLLLARETGVSIEEQSELAIGALLHDIGMSRLPEDLSTKRMELMTPAELKIYESHCWEGAQLVRQCSQVPGSVIAILYEHHENVLGTGFPRALPKENIHPLAQIVGLADHFCELTLGDPQHQDFLSAHAALNTISNVEGHPYRLDLVKALADLVRTAGGGQ